MERSQAIYKLALDVLPKGASDDLYRAYVSFEKQHGDRDAIEEVVINKRRFIYEESIEKNPRNYDVWSGAESFLPVSPKGKAADRLKTRQWPQYAYTPGRHLPRTVSLFVKDEKLAAAPLPAAEG
ncbi:CLF1 [Symbiodinium natans]|uniref:CLF1 protein n=1 Tax=Symbiodinium natans TaxID=878477 RepID=A0A812S1Z0_9DINO|nr:CLF1 [Symbiodinium natans]